MINTDDLQNFTVFIKTVVTFTQYNIKMFVNFIGIYFFEAYFRRRTVQKNTNFSCRFNSDTDRYCPIFSIGYILQNLYKQDPKIDLMALYHQVRMEFQNESNLFVFLQGGLIEIQQKWKCDFDFSKAGTECFPTFAFNLLQSGSDELSPGINYR